MRREQLPVLTVLVLMTSCRLLSQGSSPEPQDDAGAERATPGEGDTGLAAAARDAAARSEAPSSQVQCVHQRRADLGVPVHAEKGGGGGFVRLSECTRLATIEAGERWLRVAFPLTDGRTEGWVSKRYVMDCQPCDAAGGRAADGGGSPQSWPPQPSGMCQSSGATGHEALEVAEVTDVAEAGGGARGLPGVGVKVLSYNLWELYDGQGEERYLAERAHGGTPAEQYTKRAALFARTLKRLEVDLLLLQEVDGAAVACSLAGRAWPDSGWSCFSTRRSAKGFSQNIAVATRLKGNARWLRSRDSRATGPRGALEFSLEGAGGLTVTAVHLQSSRGQASHADCANARKRMGAAAALARRYDGWSSVIVAGDFNVDPGDTGRALYDRTADVLLGRGFERLCPAAAGCQAPTYLFQKSSTRAKQRGSAIDLAFFRGGGSWRAESFRVIDSAPHRGQNPLGSDHLPIEIHLRR